jgi:hypothetical protein
MIPRSAQNTGFLDTRGRVGGETMTFLAIIRGSRV